MLGFPCFVFLRRGNVYRSHVPFVLRGRLYFLVKERAADLDKEFIYNCYYRGIAITHVLKISIKHY